MNKVKPFYILITDDMTAQMAQDALDKCVCAGAYPLDGLDVAQAKIKYEHLIEFDWRYFGVSKTGRTLFYDSHASFGIEAKEITLDQLDEWLGIESDKSEWKNGDECVKDGEKYIYLSRDPFKERYSICVHARNGLACAILTSALSKPETPQQKEERERFEAAYEIYLAFLSASKSTIIPMNTSEFKECLDLKRWLAVVNKTGYRKQ